MDQDDGNQASRRHAATRQVDPKPQYPQISNKQIAQMIKESMRNQHPINPAEYHSKKEATSDNAGKSVSADSEKGVVASKDEEVVSLPKPQPRANQVTLASRKPGAKPFGVVEQRQDGEVTYSSKTNILSKTGQTIYLIVGQGYDDFETAAQVRDLAAVSMGANDGAKLNNDADYYGLRMVEHLVLALIEENPHLFTNDMLLPCLARAASHGVQDDLPEHHPYHTMLQTEPPPAAPTPAVSKTVVRSKSPSPAAASSVTEATDLRPKSSRVVKRSRFFQDDSESQGLDDDQLFPETTRRKRTAAAVQNSVDGKCPGRRKSRYERLAVQQDEDSISTNIQDDVLVSGKPMPRSDSIASIVPTSQPVGESGDAITKEQTARNSAAAKGGGIQTEAGLSTRPSNSASRPQHNVYSQVSQVLGQQPTQQIQVSVPPPSKQIHQRLANIGAHGGHVVQPHQQFQSQQQGVTRKSVWRPEAYRVEQHHFNSAPVATATTTAQTTLKHASAVTATGDTQKATIQNAGPLTSQTAGSHMLARAVFASTFRTGSEPHAMTSQSAPAQHDVALQGGPSRAQTAALAPSSAAVMHQTFKSATALPVSSLVSPNSHPQIMQRALGEPSPQPHKGNTPEQYNRGGTSKGGAPVNSPPYFGAWPDASKAVPKSSSSKPWLPR